MPALREQGFTFLRRTSGTSDSLDFVVDRNHFQDCPTVSCLIDHLVAFITGRSAFALVAVVLRPARAILGSLLESQGYPEMPPTTFLPKCLALVILTASDGNSDLALARSHDPSAD